MLASLFAGNIHWILSQLGREVQGLFRRDEHGGIRRAHGYRQPKRHHPRKRVNQYPRALVIEPKSRGVLGPRWSLSSGSPKARPGGGDDNLPARRCAVLTPSS